MKYDDASWHYEGDFPEDLPADAGATHTGMFLAWALLSGLGGELHLEEMLDGVVLLNKRATTPGQFFLQYCDGKLTDEDLSDMGNAFAVAYFDFETGKFLTDYEQALAGDLPTLYHVPDTWESFDVIRPILDRRYAEWTSGAFDTQDRG